MRPPTASVSHNPRAKCPSIAVPGGHHCEPLQLSSRPAKADALTADIRAALTQTAALTGPTVTVESLANKGLTRAEARDPMSYDKGDVVRFTRRAA